MIAVGQLVKFRTVVDPGDADERMRVLEVMGDRARLEDASDYWRGRAFVPQSVYPINELEDAS